MPLPSTHGSQITLPPYFLFIHPRLHRVYLEQAFFASWAPGPHLLKQLVAFKASRKRRQEIVSRSFLPSVPSIVLSRPSQTDTAHSYANSSGIAMTIRATRRGSPSRDKVSPPHAISGFSHLSPFPSFWPYRTTQPRSALCYVFPANKTRVVDEFQPKSKFLEDTLDDDGGRELHNTDGAQRALVCA